MVTCCATGKAARAQEWLCQYAERIEAQGAGVAERLASEPRVKFSWIQDRVA